MLIKVSFKNSLKQLKKAKDLLVAVPPLWYTYTTKEQSYGCEIFFFHFLQVFFPLKIPAHQILPFLSFSC